VACGVRGNEMQGVFLNDVPLLGAGSRLMARRPAKAQVKGDIFDERPRGDRQNDDPLDSILGRNTITGHQQ
jgi:hypothetical protein